MKFLTTDFNTEEAMYLQLYNKIKSDILSKKLLPNEKLPSKRELHKHLSISINTIMQAYDLLLDEGYITSIPQKGYYVLDYNIDVKKSVFKKSNESKKIIYKYDLTTKGIDKSIFPLNTWNKISKEIIYEQEFINKSSNMGSVELRKTIAEYLYETKGINVNYHNIVIGSGIEYLLTLLINILPVDSYAIENPGYDKIAKLLLNNNKEVIYSDIDNDGISISGLKDATCVYVTPANQFPTGVKMSLARKLDLIKWAKNKYIIEDDFDSEFKYLSNISTSLFALSPANTIFLSTYSRTITPSIRISYMILPDAILDKYKKKYSFYSSTVSTLDQLILNNFIKSGSYSRHINKTKNLYKQKRSLIINKLKNMDYLKIDLERSYLSLIVDINNLDKLKFKELCKDNLIDISIMQDYMFNDRLSNKIIIGYSSIDINILDEAIDLLIGIIKQCI